MRGDHEQQADMYSYISPEQRVPADHPLRGRAGLELRFKGLLVNPEIVMANHQDRIFPTETPTAGYAVFNVSGSYLIARQHTAHIISFNFFNVGDTLCIATISPLLKSSLRRWGAD
jgi:hypothetical protein